MKKYEALAILGAFSLFFASCEKREVQGQGSSQEGGLQDSSYPNYNVKAEETIKGVIIAVKQPYGQVGPVELLIKTEKGEMPVHLGPSWFIQDGISQLRPGDEIKIKGVVIYIQGQVIVIARKIETDRYELKLRDDDGLPLWSGWKRK